MGDLLLSTHYPARSLARSRVLNAVHGPAVGKRVRHSDVKAWRRRLNPRRLQLLLFLLRKRVARLLFRLAIALGVLRLLLPCATFHRIRCCNCCFASRIIRPGTHRPQFQFRGYCCSFYVAIFRGRARVGLHMRAGNINWRRRSCTDCSASCCGWCLAIPGLLARCSFFFSCCCFGSCHLRGHGSQRRRWRR